jgi:hypothetical protein
MPHLITYTGGYPNTKQNNQRTPTVSHALQGMCFLVSSSYHGNQDKASYLQTQVFVQHLPIIYKFLKLVMESKT